ncbi:MAG: 2-oxo acid dehydrogenase subunit E2 [Clostridia bacterium]|nr:2-oxo acid dehydrogenase subunit E2 [Clostridia bacterium]
MMPKQGITVESCILTEWKVKVGDAVKVGDVLFSYETDKASFDQESEFEGEVLALLVEAGEEVPVLNFVCVIGSKGDDISCFTAGGAAPAPAAAPAAAPAPVASAPAAAPASATASAPVRDGERIFASPRARKLAEKMGVDLKDAIPTGPNGRIVEADVRVASTKPKAEVAAPAAVAAAPAAASADFKAFTDEKMPNIRKVIAKNMMNSLSSMAQLTHTLSFDCTNVMAFRAYLKANAEKLNLPNITINDIIIFAVSRVIKNHKVLNAHLLNGDTMRYFEHVNIGIATDAPKGLLVPVLNGADTMSLTEISQNAKKLTKGAQSGTISPELLSGGSFTISNLGTMGIESFTPVINPPQTGILGVNSFETRIKLGKNGEIVPYTAMALSLTYDHRALDGAPASRFLKELKEYLESFSLNLVVDSKGL